MRAGLLRHAITITAPPASAKDPFGQPLASAATNVLTCNASINAISGKEAYAIGAGFDGQVSHMVVIRTPAVAINAGMTVNFGTRSFLVQYVFDPDERGRELHLTCQELTT